VTSQLAQAPECSAHAEWLSLQTHLRVSMATPEYLSLFITAQAKSLTDGTLALAVSNDFASQRIRSKHRDTIHAWVATSEHVDQVAIVVDSSLSLPERFDNDTGPTPTLRTAQAIDAAITRQGELPPGIIAQLLAERGFWSLAPSASQMALFEIDDLHGMMQVVPSALGVSGMREAMVFTGLLTLWGAGERSEPVVETSLKRLADVIGMSWSGNTAALLRDSVRLLKHTGYHIAVQHSTVGGWEEDFSILDRVRTEWTGPASSPHRRIRAVFSEAIFEQISTQTTIRPIDLAVLRAIGEQRTLARRLYLLLESLPAHTIDSRTHYMHRIVDQRLAGTLGVTQSDLYELRRNLTRAGKVLMGTDPRYGLVDVAPRAKRDLRRGEPKYLLRAFRARPAAALGR
jgi:hypothetical protein